MMPKTQQTFSQRLRELREASGQTQKAAAATAGLDQTRWSNYERGVDPRADPKLIRRICTAIDCDPNTLFGWPQQ
jgi:transcriptional regulator with XRE-family HTH domain